MERDGEKRHKHRDPFPSNEKKLASKTCGPCVHLDLCSVATPLVHISIDAELTFVDYVTNIHSMTPFLWTTDVREKRGKGGSVGTFDALEVLQYSDSSPISSFRLS